MWATCISVTKCRSIVTGCPPTTEETSYNTPRKVNHSRFQEVIIHIRLNSRLLSKPRIAPSSCHTLLRFSTKRNWIGGGGGVNSCFISMQIQHNTQKNNILFYTQWHTRICQGDKQGLSKRFELWPPRSPDLTPCDSFLWGYVKDNAYKPPLPQNVRELQDAGNFLTSCKPVSFSRTTLHHGVSK